MTPPRWARIIVGLTLIIGGYLPWVQILGIGVSGLNGDGVITFSLGILIAATAFGGHRAWSWLTIAASSICALIALADMTNFAASGIYLTLLAGLAGVGVGVMGLRRRVEVVA